MRLNGDCVLHYKYRKKTNTHTNNNIRITHQAPRFRWRGTWAYCEATLMKGLNTSHKLKKTNQYRSAM